MPKPSAVLSCVVIFLSIALIALVVSGLVVYLDKYKDFRDLGVWSALALSGFFTPLLGVPILLLSLITLCCVAPEEPSQPGRRCLGLFWFLTAVICTASILLSLLSFLIDSILELVFSSCKNTLEGDSGPSPTTPSISSECDEIINIGKYLSIASAVVFSIVAICAVVLCCFGCCFQEVDEEEHRTGAVI